MNFVKGLALYKIENVQLMHINHLCIDFDHIQIWDDSTDLYIHIKLR